MKRFLIQNILVLSLLTFVSPKLSAADINPPASQSSWKLAKAIYLPLWGLELYDFFLGWHAKEQALQRGISSEDIENTLAHGRLLYDQKKDNYALYHQINPFDIIYLPITQSGKIMTAIIKTTFFLGSIGHAKRWRNAYSS